MCQDGAERHDHIVDISLPDDNANLVIFFILFLNNFHLGIFFKLGFRIVFTDPFLLMLCKAICPA